MRATAEGQVSVLDVPPALARVASPLAYPDLVTATARARGVDPLLFTSLMHQESDFDPYAESVAKAKGLTQIIPQTGTRDRPPLGVKDFRQEDLYHAKQNVQFGAWYFGERLKRNGVGRPRPGQLQRRRRQRRQLDPARPRRPRRLHRIRPLRRNARLRQRDPDVLVDQ